MGSWATIEGYDAIKRIEALCAWLDEQPDTCAHRSEIPQRHHAALASDHAPMRKYLGVVRWDRSARCWRLLPGWRERFTSLLYDVRIGK